MIISLFEAKQINPDIKQEDLDAFEQAIRSLTNNKFQNTNVRFENVAVKTPNIIEVDKRFGLRIGDTVELNYSAYNDGLYVVEQIGANEITVEGKPFLDEKRKGMTVTLINYPADLKKNVKSLIEYDVSMKGKVGIKSETVSRMSTTYYDNGSNESVDGYPSSLLSFLRKYEKMGWG